ncbi:hypothetical protein [Alkalicoccobacillus gibsonii]|uniref:hypothetical protein n=1 Tax=Alkalicoccobacillus gibsonii TaxID=79881 RepID=UPI00193414BB|nr:hypothetical protein [Alkalicoccobacillus gibsonii]MBM0064919.1 hypothetical protein [Alkalicoccobacillus gibsonii]
MKLPEVTPYTIETPGHADDLNKRQNELKERDEKIAEQLRLQDAITALLQKGINVVESVQPSPVNLVIEGQSRVNLLGVKGSLSSNTYFDPIVNVRRSFENGGVKLTAEASASLEHYVTLKVSIDKSKRHLIIVEYEAIVGRAQLRTVNYKEDRTFVESNHLKNDKKGVARSFTPADTSEVQIRLQLNKELENGNAYVADGETSFFKKLRVYELTNQEYQEAITLSEAQLAEKFPYIEGVKHVRNPFLMKKGKNLLPAFPDNFTSRLASSDVVTLKPYELKFVANGSDQFARFHVPVLPNQTYFLQCEVETDGNNNGVIAFNKSEISNDDSAYVSTGASRGVFKTLPGTKYLEIRLSSLSTPGTYLFKNFSLTLGSERIPFEPLNNDQIYFPETLLGSSLDGSVRDRIYKVEGNYFLQEFMRKDYIVNGSETEAISYFQESYIGFKRLKFEMGSAIKPRGRAFAFQPSTGIYFTEKPVSGNDWTINTILVHGDSFGSTSVTIANSITGWDDDKIPSNSEVRAFFKANPLILTYELNRPILRDISEEGEIGLHSGANLVNLGEGLIVREKTVPVLDQNDGNYKINHASATIGGQLKYKTEKILAVYKDGVIDLNANIISGDAHGLQRVSFGKNYDPDAEYTVTYVPLDKHTLSTAITRASVIYQSSFKSAFEKEVERNTDTKEQVTVHELMLAEVVKALRQLKGV